MRFSPIPVALALVAVLASGFASQGASAAPEGISTRALDLELKAADVTNVLRMLADASGRKLTLDPCVHGTVDLRMKNTPLPLVLDALAMKLGLVYEERGEDILVRCAGDSGAKVGEQLRSARVSLAEKEAALPEVVARLAASAKLDGVDYRATSRPRVTITLEGVRLSTVVTALSEATGLNLAIARGRLVVTE